jgi:hypothetical protein
VLFSVLAVAVTALLMKDVYLSERAGGTEDAGETTGELLPDVSPAPQPARRGGKSWSY